MFEKQTEKFVKTFKKNFRVSFFDNFWLERSKIFNTNKISIYCCKLNRIANFETENSCQGYDYSLLVKSKIRNSPYFIAHL